MIKKILITGVVSAWIYYYLYFSVRYLLTERILLAELIWLTAFFEVLGAEVPAMCLPLKHKKADCSYHPTNYLKQTATGVKLKDGDNYDQVEVN